MKKAIRFLSLAEVKIIHAAVIVAHGGSLELRDEGLLQSAIAMPSQQFGGQFLHSDLSTMAAAYLYHLNKNHAFVDGNKRVALTTCETFLQLNGFVINATNDEVVEITLQVADGRLDKERLTDWIKARIQPAEV